MYHGRRALVLASLGLAWLAAGGKVAAQAPEEPARITAEELKPLVAKGEAVVLDVRGLEAWNAGHIEGAVHIPMAELAKRVGELPKDKLIAPYCTCHAEATSAGAVRVLKQNGFAKAAALKDGMSAWQRVGGKVTAPAAPAPAH